MESLSYDTSHADTLCAVLRRLSLLGQTDELPLPYALKTGVAGKSAVYFLELSTGKHIIAKFDKESRASAEWSVIEELETRDTILDSVLPISGNQKEDRVILYQDMGAAVPLVVDFSTLLQEQFMTNINNCLIALKSTLNALSRFHDREPGRYDYCVLRWIDIFPSLSASLNSDDILEVLKSHLSALTFRFPPLSGFTSGIDSLLKSNIGWSRRSRIHGDLNLTNILFGLKEDNAHLRTFMIDLTLSKANTLSALDFARLESEFWHESFVDLFDMNNANLSLAVFQIRDLLEGREQALQASAPDYLKNVLRFLSLLRRRAFECLGANRPEYVMADYAKCLLFTHLSALKYSTVNSSPDKICVAVTCAATSYIWLRDIESGRYADGAVNPLLRPPRDYKDLHAPPPPPAPIDLENPEHIYVPPYCSLAVTFSNKTFPKGERALTTVTEILKDDGIPIMLGSYGMGKSFFARRLYTEFITGESTITKRPVHIPLRDYYYSRNASSGALNAVWLSFQRNISMLEECPSEKEFLSAAEQGRFLFIFDGLDEIPYVSSTKAVAKIIKECSDLHDPNDVMITSRDGVIANILGTEYKLLHLLNWTDEQFGEYVRACSSLLDKKNITESAFLDRVFLVESLHDLAQRPLYARLMLQFAEHVVRSCREEISEFFLLDKFVNQALEIDILQKKGAAFQDIQGRFQLLMFIADYFFTNGLTSALTDELKESALKVVALDADKLITCFDREIRLYSLMVPASEERVAFSHESIHDFFLAKLLSLYFSHEITPQLESLLNAKRSLTKTTIRLLCQFHHSADRILLTGIDALRKSTKSRRVMGNCILLLMGLNRIKDMHPERCLFTGADLSDFKLDGLQFKGCDFYGVNLDNTSMKGCRFERCVLSDTSVSGADFSDCDFSGAGTEISQLRMMKEWPARFGGALFENARVVDGENDPTRRLIQECLKAEANMAGNMEKVKSSLESLNKAK